MYESSYAIIHKIRLYTLSLRYERFLILRCLRCGCIYEISYAISCKSINFLLLVKPRIKLFNILGETHVNVVVGCSGCVYVFGCLVCMNVPMLSFIKLGCLRCRCGMKENILNFVLSPLRMVYMKFLMSSVIKLGCKRCIGWKGQVEIFLLSVKMSCLRCFCCTMKFPMPSVIKLGCKLCVG